MQDHVLLTPETAIAYLRQRTQLFPAGARLEAAEISGVSHSVEGFVNQIIRVKDPASGRSVILKQVLPYLKLIPELSPEAPLSLRRMKVEVEAFRLWNSLTPGCTPEILMCDEAAGVEVMEDLAQMKLARFEFAQLKHFPHFARQVGRFLAKNAFFTSDLFLDTIDKKNLVTQFTIPDFRAVYENAFFNWTFFHPFDHPDDEIIRPELEAFMAEPAVRVEVLKLREIYLTRAQALIHNDFHTSNIFVSPTEMRVVDGEAAGWGPLGYDLGTLFGNLIVNCLSLQVMDEVPLGDKIAYEDYLLDTLRQIVDEFNRVYCEAWEAHARPECRHTPEYRTYLLRSILQEAAGYAGCTAFGRCHGPGASYDFRRIADPQRRAVGQRLVLRTARSLLLERERFEHIEQITTLLKEIKTGHKIALLVSEKLAKLQG